MTTKNVIHEICHVIATLPEHASLDDVSRQLADFVAPVKSVGAAKDGVTPLMVACDKNQPACLEYMLQMNPSLLWGEVGNHSSQECGANTALHHAAMSGCIKAIDLFGVEELLHKTNLHQDTPIMMACAYNQVAFLKKLHETLCHDELLSLLQHKNKSGQLSISLAFGHGHAEVVQFLLAVGVESSYEMVQDCKRDLKDMDAIVLRSGEDFKQQKQRVKQCLVILEVALAKKSRDAMEELIQKENQEVEKEKRRKKSDALPRKQHRDSRPKPAPVPAAQAKVEQSSSAWTTSQQEKVESEEPITQPRFRTLADGTVVSNSSDISHSVVSQEVEVPVMQEARSVNELLRDRLREPAYHDDGIDAVMDSLCLDASMLLLTPHGMAMNLSPSQLEAIAKILQKQVKSVAEAKEIQERIRQT